MIVIAKPHLARSICVSVQDTLKEIEDGKIFAFDGAEVEFQVADDGVAECAESGHQTCLSKGMSLSVPDLSRTLSYGQAREVHATSRALARGIGCACLWRDYGDGSTCSVGPDSSPRWCKDTCAAVNSCPGIDSKNKAKLSGMDRSGPSFQWFAQIDYISSKVSCFQRTVTRHA